MTPRIVEPEWLDVLPADDPRAVRARGDLRRVNAWMRHGVIMARALAGHWTGAGPRALLDLGSGDGAFMLRVARRLAQRWPGVHVVLLDRQAIVGAETRRAFGSLGWTVEAVAADVFEYLERTPPPGVDIVTANLFLHHLEPGPLARLLGLAAERAALFVACEPRRAALPLAASRLLWAIGCNGVTRHDAPVSVRAGFRASELSALWPRDGCWQLHERNAPPFSHCFAARREARPAP